MNRPEEAAQRSIVEYLRWVRPDCIWFAVANQRGTRTKAEMGVLKALGVRPGVADLVLAWRGGVAFLEVKAPGREGNLSPAQLDFKAACERRGIPYQVVSDLGEVRSLLVDLGVLRPKPDHGGPRVG